MAWVSGIPGLALSLASAVMYVPMGQKALREGRMDRAAAVEVPAGARQAGPQGTPDVGEPTQQALDLRRVRGGLGGHAAVDDVDDDVPVLVGEEGSTDMMLSSPLVLPDYPRIAPESPHWKYFNDERGYVRCTVDASSTVAELRVVDFAVEGVIGARLAPEPVERSVVDPAPLPRPTVPLMLNLANPERAFHLAQLPTAGVGLLRIDDGRHELAGPRMGHSGHG